MVTITKDHFSIRQICESGQCFRLEELGKGEEEETYALTALGKYLEIRQKGKRITFGCSDLEFEQIWKNYFDLEGDYKKVIDSIDREDRYLMRAAGYGSGIRILRQDLWEMIVSFLISQQNHIARISRTISSGSGSALLLCAKPMGNKSKPRTEGFFMTFRALRYSPGYRLRSCMPVIWDTAAAISTRPP